MRILGIDPGTSRIGYGLIEKKGSYLKLINSGLLEIPGKEDKKLLILAKKFDKLVKKLKPDFAAIEKLYFFKNQKTAIEVAEARGVLILILFKNKIPFIGYTPLEIKQKVTGYGLSDKKAVAKMVGKILDISTSKMIDDITDALAIAISASMDLPPHHNEKNN